MTPAVRFGLDELFFLALRKEQEAETFYERLSERISDRELRRLLKLMAKQEKAHSLRLLRLYGSFNRRYDELPENLVRKAPELADTARRYLGRRSASEFTRRRLSESECLDLACEAEDRAVEFYGRLALLFNPKYASVFRLLARDERMHKRRLERWKRRLSG
ncbi:MAG: ferritin family protein [Candidatus Omnitrophica bacterium]|nr:ferritin family protein [Candidatus Omnitrophota bacterium]